MDIKTLLSIIGGFTVLFGLISLLSDVYIKLRRTLKKRKPKLQKAIIKYGNSSLNPRYIMRIKKLLNKTGYINLSDKYGKTALMFAVYYHLPKVVNLLLAHPCINTEIKTIMLNRDKLWNIPSSSYAQARVIFYGQADVKLLDGNKYDALMLAKRWNYFEIIELIERHIKVDLKLTDEELINELKRRMK